MTAEPARDPRGGIAAANLPQALRAELVPALVNLVQWHQPEGLWLFGSWARGSASRRSDVDLLVMGLNEMRLLDAYHAVLEALQDCRLPLQPLVAGQALLAKHGDSPFWRSTATPPSGEARRLPLLAKHGDSPFWRSVKAEAIPLLEGCRFP